jgi:transposase
MRKKLITMTNKESRSYDIIKDLINKKINGTQASIKLNLSIRQTKRLKVRVKKYGIEGVIHKSRGKESNRKICNKLVEKILKITKENYLDFSSQLTYEKLLEIHNISLSYSTVRRIRINNGLNTVKDRKKNKKHFKKRERKEYYGEMQQFDGSYHDWLEGRCTDMGLEEEQCLLLSVDDATGEPTAKLAKNESIKAAFSFWKDYIIEKGKPISIYVDKFSTYKINHKNAEDNKEFKTQFKRAIEDELGIKVIFAGSAQAKGRVERMNGTFQDRLIKELRLAKINNTKEANEFIKKEFIPIFSKKFNVRAKKEGNLHTKPTKKEINNLDHVFSVKKFRKVRNDFVVQYKNRYFQLDEIQITTVYKKDEVIVEEHLDDSIHICKKTNHGDKYLSFKELPAKPVKEIEIKLPAITRYKTSYIPPINHPWRSFKFSNRQKTKQRIED